MDRVDQKILRLLQEDATLSVTDVGKEVGLSTMSCWRRIQKLEADRTIKRTVAILDPEKVNANLNLFISIKTSSHSSAWMKRFIEVVEDFHEVVEFYRMSGEVDFLLRVVVPDLAAYDGFYKRLVSKIDIENLSSALAIEQIKYTTALPLDNLPFSEDAAGDHVGCRPTRKTFRAKNSSASGSF
jgi:Lrp/AsnC family transcriptional regulator